MTEDREYKKVRRAIPFSLTPSCWFSSGKDREKSRACYEYRGEDMERKLADIEYQDQEDKLSKRHLDLDLKYKKISDIEHEKSLASLNDEPWVKVINSDYAPEKGPNGLIFELDWNEEFITMLRESGYTGVSPDLIVNDWFDDLCRTIAYEDGLLDELGGNIARTGVTTRTETTDGKIEYS